MSCCKQNGNTLRSNVGIYLAEADSIISTSSAVCFNVRVMCQWLQPFIY